MEKYYWLFLRVIFFVIPLSQFVSVRLVVIALVWSFFVGDAMPSLGRLWRSSWDKIFFLAVMAFGVIYSYDMGQGLRTLETTFSLLAMPVILSRVAPFDSEKINQSFYAFIAGLAIACLVCLGKAGYIFATTGNSDVFFFDKLTEVIDLQPTYLAYYIIAAIAFGLHHVSYEKNTSFFIWTPTILVMFLLLVLTGGRTTFIGLLLVFSFFMLKYILEPRTRAKDIVFALVCVMITGLFVVNSLDYWPIGGDYWERIDLWRSSIKANPNPVFGVGTGDYKLILNEYYRKHGLDEFAAENLNSHNQFLQAYFSNGLLGICAILILVFRPLYLATRYQHTLGVLIFFPFLIYGVTEVFLGRYQGVIFFAMLQAIFTLYYDTYSQSVSLKAG